ncbi:MAG: aminotransferase class V-fold PLP-dependent enzyme [Anaerolineales bacterium]|nr:MAG: aminotransferase class V-fold PLP-dependent enzyme [Anaerolineales bacterium]
MPELEKLIYLDNAATTYPKPENVYQAADEFYRCYGGNAGRGANPLARKSAELIAETRAMLADWLGAPSAERVILTPSATIALNLAILGTKLRSGDVVYVTPFEHNSVLRPLEHLRQSVGVEVRGMPFDRRTMACRLDRIAAQFRADPPALVCVTQASNVCGVMPPVGEIARLARESSPNVVVVVDGAQVAGLYPLPLDDGLIDAYVFSGHKSLHGPYGVAGLVLTSDWRPAPILFGGTGTISESVQMPSTLPSAYEVGSHNVWAVAGLKAALEWLQKTGRETVITHTLELAKQLRDELRNLPGIQVYTPPKGEPWCGIVSFTVEDTRPQTIEAALGAKGIAVRAGLHCAPWAHRWLGTIADGGAVRSSPGSQSSVKDISVFAELVAQISGRDDYQ